MIFVLCLREKHPNKQTNGSVISVSSLLHLESTLGAVEIISSHQYMSSFPAEDMIIVLTKLPFLNFKA